MNYFQKNSIGFQEHIRSTQEHIKSIHHSREKEVTRFIVISTKTFFLEFEALTDAS